VTVIPFPDQLLLQIFKTSNVFRPIKSQNVRGYLFLFSASTNEVLLHESCTPGSMATKVFVSLIH